MATQNLPTLTINLRGPDGNVFMVLGKVQATLKAAHGRDEGAAQMQKIDDWMQGDEGDGEYESLLTYIHENFCRINDPSGVFEGAD